MYEVNSLCAPLATDKCEHSLSKGGQIWISESPFNLTILSGFSSPAKWYIVV